MKREDLGKIIKEEADFIEPYAKEKGISLDLSLPQEPVILKLDPFLIRLAITNILSNAVKFSLSGGIVRIQLSLEGGKVFLKISDQGMGIPPEDLPHVFEKFFRSTQGSKAIISGTGLGLHITKLIVEAHQGEINLESGLDRGTSVTVVLPRE